MPAKILIVDDEVIVAESTRVALTELGYIISGLALTGAEALAAVERTPPDLVLMDINLGDHEDGVAVADCLRERHHLPVVYVTAYSDAATLARAKVAHPFGYVTKPFEAHDLQVAIEIALYNHALERRLERSEAAQRESEHRQRAILDNIADPAWLKDLDGRYLAVNRAWCEFFGLSAAETIGQTDVAVLPSARSPEIRERNRLVLASGRRLQTEECIPDQAGRPTWFEVSRTPLRNEDNAIVGAVGLAHNITRRREAELTLAEHVQTYTALLNTTRDGVLETDEEDRIQQANDGYCRLSGYTKTELQEMRIGQLEAIESTEDVAVHTQRLIRDGGGRFESRHRTKDGRLIDLEITVTHIPSRRRFVAFCHDITERKRVEHTLRFLATGGFSASDDFFRALARFLADELSVEYVCIDRLEGDGLRATTVAVFSDGHFEDNLTYSLADTPCGDVVGKAVCCFPSEVRRRFPRDVALEELRAESYAGVTLFGHTGRPIGLIAVIGRQPLIRPGLAETVLRLVATRAAGELERSEAEQARRASEQLFRAVWEKSVDGMRLLDPEGRMLAVNDAFCRLVARPREELEGQLFTTIYDETVMGPQARLLQRYRDRFAQRVIPAHEERKVVFLGGREAFVAVSSSHLTLPDGREALLGVYRDVTERVRAEQSLRQSEARLRQAQNLAGLGLWEWDAITDQTTWSDEMLRIYGITREQFTGRGQDYLACTHPEDRATQAENIRRDFERAKARGSDSPILDDAPNPKEFRIVRPDGTVRWVCGDAVEVLDDTGRPGRMLGILQDVTARREAELGLREAEERYRGLIESAFDGSVIHQGGVIVAANATYATMFGYRLDELIGRPVLDLTPPDVRERVAAIIAAKSETPYETLGLRKDGSRFSIETVGKSCTFRGRPARMAAVRDISERILAEEELRRISRWLFASQRLSMTGGWALNLQTGAVWASPEARRIYGANDAPMSLAMIQAYPLPKFREGLNRALQDLIHSGQPYDVEFSILRASDGAVVDIRSQAEYHRQENLVLGVVQDVTARNRAAAALRESEEKFAKAFRSAPVMMTISSLDDGAYLAGCRT